MSENIKDNEIENKNQLIQKKKKFTIWRQLAKQSTGNHRNKQKESPKMGRQRKNFQSKGMEDSPLRELNEMEASKLSHVEFKGMVISSWEGTHRQL